MAASQLREVDSLTDKAVRNATRSSSSVCPSNYGEAAPSSSCMFTPPWSAGRGIIPLQLRPGGVQEDKKYCGRGTPVRGGGVSALTECKPGNLAAWDSPETNGVTVDRAVPEGKTVTSRHTITDCFKIFKPFYAINVFLI